MEYITQFISPELLVLVPVLYFVGAGLKRSQSVADRHIPVILGAAGVALATVYVLATGALTGAQAVLTGVFSGVVQGVLCAGASVYVNQIIKQSGKDGE